MIYSIFFNEFRQEWQLYRRENISLVRAQFVRWLPNATVRMLSSMGRIQQVGFSPSRLVELSGLPRTVRDAEPEP